MAVARAVRSQVGVLCLLLVLALARQLSCSRCARRKNVQADDESYQKYPFLSAVPVGGNHPKSLARDWTMPIFRIDYNDADPTLNYTEKTTRWHVEEEKIPCDPARSTLCRFRSICGKAAGLVNSDLFKIVGGQGVSYGEFPSFVEIALSGDSYCGGTLVSDRHVLTAAHCLVTPDNQVRKVKSITLADQLLGSVDGHETLRGSSDVCVSKKFARLPSRQPVYDWALLTLDEPVEFNNYIQPACLPYEPTRRVGAQAVCYAIGEGVNKVMPIGSSHITSYPDEVQKLRVERVSCRPFSVNDLDYSRECYMKRVDKEGGDTCHGDSGGPILCREDGRWTLSGIVSFGSQNCDGTNSYRWSFGANRVRTSLRDIMEQCGV